MWRDITAEGSEVVCYQRGAFGPSGSFLLCQANRKQEIQWKEGKEPCTFEEIEDMENKQHHLNVLLNTWNCHI